MRRSVLAVPAVSMILMAACNDQTAPSSDCPEPGWPEYLEVKAYAVTDENGITSHWHNGVILLVKDDGRYIPDWISR